jgi:hypothetical protein
MFYAFYIVKFSICTTVIRRRQAAVKLAVRKYDVRTGSRLNWIRTESNGGIWYQRRLMFCHHSVK